jgi:hypothetical protein
MKKNFALCITCAIAFTLKAQSPASNTQEYGKVDKADLEMKACEFEKEANAEILFDKGKLAKDIGGMVYMERHTRIKIFNEFGKGYGSIRITYGTTLLPSMM